MAQPNVIFLHSHNTGRYVEPYGHRVPTPALMQLARDGMMFRQAYAAAPTCSPSRASFLTGQYPHCAGMMGLAHRGHALHDYRQHLANTLKGAGYRTALCGVEHTAKHSSSVGYDTFLETHGNNAAQVAPRVCEFLRQPQDRPFFLSVGLNETHIPFPSPDPQHHPAEDARYCAVPAGLPDHGAVRRNFAGFVASARVMDQAYGDILQALADSGQADNTLVCCFSDHGLQFPRHMCNLTDHGLGVYLVLRGPGGFSGGKSSDSMVSLMDLYPTVCELAGLPLPLHVQGRSLLPLTTEPNRPHHEVLFGEVTYHASYEPMRSVRTARYKYIRRFGDRHHLILPNVDDGMAREYLLVNGWQQQERAVEQLYDLVFDPVEQNNLASDPAHAATLAELRARLHAFMHDTGDPLLQGPVPLPPGVVTSDPDGWSWLEPTLPPA